eukprot:1736374-Rhodomonas_salina.1
MFQKRRETEQVVASKDVSLKRWRRELPNSSSSFIVVVVMIVIVRHCHHYHTMPIKFTLTKIERGSGPGFRRARQLDTAAIEEEKRLHADSTVTESLHHHSTPSSEQRRHQANDVSTTLPKS